MCQHSRKRIITSKSKFERVRRDRKTFGERTEKHISTSFQRENCRERGTNSLFAAISCKIMAPSVFRLVSCAVGLHPSW